MYSPILTIFKLQEVRRVLLTNIIKFFSKMVATLFYFWDIMSTP